MLVCEAAGFDVVLVETVGTGQSEVAVEAMVDTFMVLVGPGGGDELQGIKRGIIELADLVVVTKADGELRHAASATASEYTSALHLLRPKDPGWTPTVLECSALESRGVAELWAALQAHGRALEVSGALGHRRAAQARAWMWGEISAGLLERIRGRPDLAELSARLADDAAAGRIPPTVAADRVLESFFGSTPRN